MKLLLKNKIMNYEKYEKNPNNEKRENNQMTKSLI